ncbi:MAG: DMT family transporter [Eubacterium sp.]|nr:DMT family transporter [Candidatus Colimonas fimequi]
MSKFSSLSPKQKAMLLMVITAMMWSIGGIFIKLISWHPLMISGARGIVSASVLGGYMVYKKIPYKLCKESAGAAIGLAASATFFVIANKLTTAANAIVLQYSAPIFILLITAIILKRALSRREIIVVGITMIGIVLFFLDQLSPGNILGNFFGILAGVFLALMFVSMGEGGDDDSIRMSGIFMAHALTAVIGLPIGLYFTMTAANAAGTGSVNGLGIAPIEIVYVLILGIFQLGIPYVLYAIASKDCPPLACSLIGMLEPLFNPVWVAIFVGELPGMFALIGAVIIIATVTWWCISDARE